MSKCTDDREPVPASPQSLVILAVYVDQAGLPPAHEPVFRTRCGADKPLSYWEMRGFCSG